MANLHVHVPLRHQADHATDLEALGLSLSLAIIDTRPRAVADDEVDGGCSSCSFVSFLKSRPDLAQYQGLTQVLAALDPLAAPSPDTGRASVYRVALPHRGADDRVLHLDAGDDQPWPTIRPQDAVIVRPDGRGPQRLLAQLERARQAGAQRILLGYARHADAIDHFPPFLEHHDLAAGWSSILAQARQLGLSGLGFAMAYPPCAMLQWSANRPLESLRARLDLQFRRMDNEASMMCPENVSGYSLLNDTRDSLRDVSVAASRFAIRTEDSLLVF